MLTPVFCIINCCFNVAPLSAILGLGVNLLCFYNKLKRTKSLSSGWQKQQSRTMYIINMTKPRENLHQHHSHTADLTPRLCVRCLHAM